MNMNSFTWNGDRLSCFAYLPLDSPLCTSAVAPPAIIRRCKCRDIFAGVRANRCSANFERPAAVIVPLRGLSFPVVDQRAPLGGNNWDSLVDIDRDNHAQGVSSVSEGNRVGCAAWWVRCDIPAHISGCYNIAVAVVIGCFQDETIRVEWFADGAVFLVLFPNKDKVSKQPVDCQRN